MSGNNAIYSNTIKAGRTSFFIDVKEAKNGNNYLSITENKFDGEKNLRSTIRVFGESVEKFRQAIDEAANAVK